MRENLVETILARPLQELQEGKTTAQALVQKISKLLPEACVNPFLIKSTQKISSNGMTSQERLNALEERGYNLFNVGEETGVLVDFLTDSGTGSMSEEQWAAIMRGSEWYAGAKSFRIFQETFQSVFGPQFEVVPAHQGRSAESTLLEALRQCRVLSEGKKVVFNAAFDTTRGCVEKATGFAPENLYCPAFEQPLEEGAPFKGNLDPQRLEKRMALGDIGMVFLTITNNTGGGQPVSLENIRRVSQLCKEQHVPLFFDACRFAENAYFIQQREHSDKSIRQIVQKMFSYVDGATFSAKKDGKANIGGPF